MAEPVERAMCRPMCVVVLDIHRIMGDLWRTRVAATQCAWIAAARILVEALYLIWMLFAKPFRVVE